MNFNKQGHCGRIDWRPITTSKRQSCQAQTRHSYHVVEDFFSSFPSLNRAGLCIRQTLAWLLVFISLAAFAVPPGTASSSAEAVCMLRAIGARHPDPRLRNADTLAAKLCPLPTEFASYEAARATINMNPRQYAGFFYVNARTLYVDAMLVRAAYEGATQVVVLGAGFDSRAYRFSASHPQLSFFEVDLPDTLAAKKQRVEALLGVLPRYVRYAGIDFDHQHLEDVLPSAGYDTHARTLFILEGVSMYIGAQGTASTLRFIARNSAPGSRLVFDYALRGAIDGPRNGLFGMAEAYEALRARGEPMVTGWTPTEAAAFVVANGLVVSADIGSDELTQRYLIGSDGHADGRMLEGNRIMDASVPATVHGTLDFD